MRMGWKNRRHRKTLVALTIVLFHVLGFLSSINAIMTTRTAQGAIAWVVALNTLPYVSLPAYWVFGRSKFNGYVDARQQEDFSIRDISSNATDSVASHISPNIGQYPALYTAEQLARIPTLSGNEVELLIDGQATFDSIFTGIDQARDYILVQFFIIKDDELGRALKAHLIEKAHEGIRVYLLYDEMGSFDLPKQYLADLRAAGIEAHAFNTRKGGGNRFQINFRNHRKNVVVDGHTAWIGGHNVGDEYLGKSKRFGHWRDTHIRITGPAALAAQLSFVEDYNWATDETPEVNWTPVTGPGHEVDVLIMPSGPADKLETASLMFVNAIQAARERIWISSPYFVPDESVVSALQLAALRGVDVRILIPDEPDHMLVYLAAFAYFGDVKQVGVKFYRYQDGFLHGKTMLIDHLGAAVGTANFDNRSFRLNFEITAFVMDPEFTAEMEQMFLDDFAQSRLMKASEYANKPYWFKLAVRSARLTSPIL